MSVSTEAQSELREFFHVREGRHRLFPKAALVGFAAGLLAVAFRAFLAVGDQARERVIQFGHAHPFGWLAPVLFGAVGAGVAILIVRKGVPEASGSGIPHLESILRRHRNFRWQRVLIGKFIGGGFALASGLVMGREGPTVQMGGAVAAGMSRWLKATTQERLVLIAAGAGAGLAAAFNAPLAGLVFVLEELQRDFRPAIFGAAFLAAACADVVSRFCSGQLPAFAVPAYPTPNLELLPAFALLGLAAGLLGVVFNKGLILSLNGFAKLRPNTKIAAGIAIGGVVGAIAYQAPLWVGGGHGLSEVALRNGLPLAILPGLFLLRFVTTLGSYGTGAPGGVFAPLLSIGAILGLAVGDVTALIAPNAHALPGAFAVVGMAAYFTGIVRAPLTGIVLIVEMTSSYALSLPLIVACFAAYAVAEALRDLPIYEALLSRDLAQAGVATEESPEPQVLEVEVEPGSPFDGRAVRDLGLPSGVLLVACRDNHREWVPDARTVLTPYLRVTALVTEGAEVLREGCETAPS